jgi:hypothetical protein
VTAASIQEKAMRSLSYPLGAVLLLGLAVAVGRADEKPAETPWYPLQVGTVWQYQITAKKDKDTVLVSRFTLKVAGLEKVGDVLCARIEMTSDGRAISFDQVAVAADGVYRYSVAGVKLNKPIRFLALPPKAGFTWPVEARGMDEVLKGTFKMGEEKGTKVPAGTYDTLTVSSDDLNSNGLPLTMVCQYAQGVGLVKQQVLVAGQESMWVLEKYEPAKK